MKNKDACYYKQIEAYARENNYNITEYGPTIIGKNFLVLEHWDKDITISFILTGSSSVEGFIYTCIYSDL